MPYSLRPVLGLLLILSLQPLNACEGAEPSIDFEVHKIWDAAPHNAFTDLIRHQDQWYCVFREGQAHVSPDGALRVLTSTDGREWTSAARLTSELGDLRDAKISVTPEGRLMLVAAIAVQPPEAPGHVSVVTFSNDGRQWSELQPVGDRNFWLWRVTWLDDTAYGIGYATGDQDRLVRLYRSNDGRSFETWVENLFDEGYPNETSIVFLPDATALCLLRRDGTPKTGLLGRAEPPYRDWTWQDLGVRIGGPEMIRLDDGRLIACVRLYDGGARTSLCWVDAEQGKIEEFLKLPSGGDTSYAGMVWHDERLYVSYYSSHEGKTSIYLAEVELPAAE